MSNFRKYLTNREWCKKIKFNNNWYELQSIFDSNRQKKNTKILNTFNFNKAIRDDNKSSQIYENMSFVLDDNDDINDIKLNKISSKGILNNINNTIDYYQAKYNNLKQIYKYLFHENKPAGYKYVEKGPIEEYPCFMINASSKSTYIKNLTKLCKSKGWTNFATEHSKNSNNKLSLDSLWFILKYSIYNKKEEYYKFIDELSSKYNEYKADYKDMYNHANDDEDFNEYIKNVFLPFCKQQKYVISNYLISEDKGLMLLTFYKEFNYKNATSILFTTGKVNYAYEDWYSEDIDIIKKEDPVLLGLKKESIRKIDTSLFTYKELTDAYVYQTKFEYKLQHEKHAIPTYIYNIYNIFKSKYNKFLYTKFNSSRLLIPEELHIPYTDKLVGYYSLDGKVLFIIQYTDIDTNRDDEDYLKMNNELLLGGINMYTKYANAYIIVYK